MTPGNRPSKMGCMFDECPDHFPVEGGGAGRELVTGHTARHHSNCLPRCHRTEHKQWARSWKATCMMEMLFQSLGPGLLPVVFENMHKDGKLKVMNSQTGGWKIYGC